MDSLPLSHHRSPGGKGPTYTVHGNIHWHSHCKEQSLKARKKQWRKLSLGCDIPTPGSTSQENHSWKRHMHPNIHYSTTYDSQNTEPAKCPPTYSSAKKIWCVHTMDYYSAIKNTWNYATSSHRDGPWRMTLREVSHTEEDTRCLI